MKTLKSSGKLNRYTQLPFLLDIVKRKKIILLDPSITWEDKNDINVVLEYKRGKRKEKLFALCFSTCDETIHHWKAFANGVSGCCIQFDREKLLKSFAGISNVRCLDITYKKIKEVKGTELDDMPFIKRYPYRIEDEFRILWEGSENEYNILWADSKERDRIEIDIKLNSITKITFSQDMPTSVYKSIKDLLYQQIHNPLLIINRSTIYKNEKWIKAFKSIK